MAVEKISPSTSLRMVFQSGVDEDGNPTFTRKSIGNMKYDATDQDIYDVGIILSDLQEYTLSGLQRTDNAELQEDD